MTTKAAKALEIGSRAPLDWDVGNNCPTSAHDRREMMRALALIVALMSMPVFAADNIPRTTRDSAAGTCQLLAQTSDGYCCRHCGRNERPCGRNCITAKDSCNEKPGGCACPFDAP